MEEVLMDYITMECPMCAKVHPVKKASRQSKAKIKGEIIDYPETVYECEETGEIFIPADVMDANLLRARDAYRLAHGFMTSQEIVQLRKRLGLTQKELALLLGWGEITVTRYETKQIQNESHDILLKAIRDNAYEARKLLIQNRENFAPDRYREILKRIDEEISRTSVQYLAGQKIQAKQIQYEEDPEATGGTTVNVDKVRNMMLFFASKCKSLYKVKLMKLLWFSDARYCQKHSTSMSGLVYQHMPMGALPVVHWDLMELVQVEAIVDESTQYESYRILPDPNFHEDVFSAEEKEVLYEVLRKFKNYSGKEIANYMHEEAAYTETKEREVIPYTLARKIRPFS